MQEAVKDTQSTAEECQEFVAGADLSGDVQVTGRVRAFVEAAAHYKKLSVDMKAKVKTACINIAADLGAEDTWSRYGDKDEAIANANGDGACDVATKRVVAIMDASAVANLTFVYVPARCYTDFEEQKHCEQRCKTDVTCDSGKVETRCEPAELSVKCDGECNVQASCEGSVENTCACRGKCESTCAGECRGTCIKPDGTRTDNDPNCMGKCTSTCVGQCHGRCRLEETVECGANVRCKGGCSTSYTEPKCESVYTPPQCEVDTDCMSCCEARTVALTKCEPARTELYANASVSVDLEVLVRTVNANYSAIIEIGEVYGDRADKAGDKLVTAGQNVLKGSADLDAKSIACATVASTEAGVAKLTVDAAVNASIYFRDETRRRAQ